MAEYLTEAYVHMPLGEGYRVKVSVIGLGMYINGAIVYPPGEKNNNRWTLFLPNIHIGHGKRMYPLEFNKQSPLWLEIYEIAVKAVNDYRVDTGEMPIQDSVVTDIGTDEDIAAGLDEAMKKFGM